MHIDPKDTNHKTTVDWLTTLAIAAIAISLTIAFHEGMHALTCIVIGGELQEYSALHVACNTNTVWQAKTVSGTASIANIILGAAFWTFLRRSRHRRSESQFFLWLFMLTNWLNGAGYWMFSGIANVGDWANVIDGWEPHWLWRIIMTIAGAGFFTLFVWFALHELGKIIGGTDLQEQINRAVKLGLFAYVAIVLVTFLAGLFNPYGLTGLPAVAGLMAALGGMSPLLWMMQWFQAKSFVKEPKEPLAIQRQWSWIIAASLIVFIYTFILGRTIYF